MISRQEFNVLGKTFIISEERARYNMYRAMFSEMAEELSEKYFKVYLKDTKDVDGIHREGMEKGILCIFEAITKSIDILVEHKIYDIDEDVFFNDYFCNYCTWDKAFNEFDERYLSIVYSAEELREYREARKNSRGRWEGGGFSMGAAIRGSVKAEAMNIATGAAHSFLNYLENRATEKKVRQEKEALAEDPRVYQALAEGIRSNVFNVHYALFDIIQQRKGAEWDIVGTQDEERVNVLLNNLMRVKDVDDKCEILLQCLQLNPYNPKIYEIMFEEGGLPVGETGKVCEFFHLDVKKLLSPVFNEYLKKCEKTESGVNACIKKINEKMERYGISDPVFILEAYKILESVLTKQYKKESDKISDNEKLRLYQEDMYQKIESYQKEYQSFGEKLRKKIEKDIRTYDGFEYPTKEDRIQVEKNDAETEAKFKELKQLSDEKITEMYEELNSMAISDSCKVHCIKAVECYYDEKLKEEGIDINSLSKEEALALSERIKGGKYSKNCKNKYAKKIKERIQILDENANKEKLEQVLETTDFNSLSSVNEVLNQLLAKKNYDKSDDEALISLIKAQRQNISECYISQTKAFFLKMNDFIRFNCAYGDDDRTTYKLKEFYKKCYEENNDFQFGKEEVPLIYYIGSVHPDYMISNKRIMINHRYFDLEPSLGVIWFDSLNSYNLFKDKTLVKFTLEPYIPKEEFRKDINRVKKHVLNGEKENEFIANKLTAFLGMVYNGAGISEPSVKIMQGNKENIAESNFIPVVNENCNSKSVEMSKAFQSKKTSGVQREDEYKELHPLVESILSSVEEHASSTKDEFTSYRIMKWEGEPKVIEGEKAPILAVLHDTNCSPRLMGEKAIDFHHVTGILPDYFYLINIEKFILYVKGEKYEWKFDNIRDLSFKEGFFSSALLVTDYNGVQKKITIHESFKMHAFGLNKIISSLRDRDKAVSDVTTVPQINENPQQNVAFQNVTKQAEADTVSSEAVQKTEKAEGNVSLTEVKRSFSEMIDYVNKFPMLSSGSFMGVLNPKFPKKVKNAVKAYAFSVRETEVFALFDDTFLGSGKEGFVMTMQGIIIKTSFADASQCAYSDIKSLRIVATSSDFDGLFLETKHGNLKITGWIGKEAATALADRINKTVMFLYGLDEGPYSIKEEYK